MRSGRRPRVLVPLSKPMAKPIDSRVANRADARLRSVRASRVSRPWIVLAAAQRRRPSLVFGPLNFLPPWNRHRDLFFATGALHLSLVLRDVPSHCLQAIRPPAVKNVVIFAPLMLRFVKRWTLNNT
jgi:hypothetical protein